MRLSRCKSASDQDATLRYGEYFEGIEAVISKDNYRALMDAVSRKLATDISLTHIKEILVFSEKHGSDYHPARLAVVVDNRQVDFVMNVAVTVRGKDRLCREFDVLQHLGGKFGFSCLPQAYFLGEAFGGSGSAGGYGTSLLMFLADWFDGYHEFHLSTGKKDCGYGNLLRDPLKGHRRLSRPQAWGVYSQAATILTRYYDFETFEQVFPWHHAAGDFVVRTQGDAVDVRLITARQYAPMIENSGEISAYEAQLLFLLNLSLRMRLDRLDGVGDVVWADDACIDATMEGFLEGLRAKERDGSHAGLVKAFHQHSASLAGQDLAEMFYALVDACDSAAPDMPVIKHHLEHHIAVFGQALREARG